MLTIMVQLMKFKNKCGFHTSLILFIQALFVVISVYRHPGQADRATYTHSA